MKTEHATVVIFVIVTALIAAPFVVRCCGGANLEYSSGSRSGVIQKLSKKGVIWKTWEGELNLGYNTATTDSDGRMTIAPELFLFSVSSEQVAKELKGAEMSGRRVTIEYKQYLLRGFDKGWTDYDITGVAEHK